MTEVYDIWLPEKIKTNLMIMAAVAQKHQVLTLTYIRVTSFTDGEIYTLDANGDFTTLESSKEDWLLGLRLLGLIEVKYEGSGGSVFLTTLAHEWLAYQRKGRIGRWFYRWTQAGKATVLFVFGGITVVLTIVNVILAILQILALLKLI